MAAKNDSSFRAQMRRRAEQGVSADEPLVDESQKVKRRPPTTLDDIRPDWQEVMLALAKEGKGITSFMVHLDVSRWAFDNLLRDSKDFRRHYDKCMLVQQEYLENAGLGMVNGKPGNAKVWAMFMVNINGWRSENARQEIAGDAQNPVVVKKQVLDSATVEELQAYVDEGDI